MTDEQIEAWARELDNSDYRLGWSAYRDLARWAAEKAREAKLEELTQHIPCNCWVINLLSDRARERVKYDRCQRCARIAELREE